MSNRANLANGLTASALDATTNTLRLQPGYAVSMPPVPFYLTITPFGQLPTMGNSEIVQVTAVSGDNLNIVRAQKGTVRKAFPANSVVSNSVYADDKIGADNIDFTTIPMFAATTSKWDVLAGGSVSIVNYNAVEYDTVKMFNKSTHQATVPVDGIYTISAKAAVTSAGYNPLATATAMVYKNGAMLEEMTRIAGSGNGLTLMRLSHTFDVLLKKGDVIDVRAHCSEGRDYGGTSTHSRFSMRFVGNNNTSND